MSEPIKGAESDNSGVHEQVLDVMISALKEHESSKHLSDEVLRDICFEAVADDRIHDLTWLEGKLSEANAAHAKNVVANKETESWKEVLSRIEPAEPKDVQSPEEFKDILRLHESWMNSVLDPKREVGAGRANLRGANLQGFDIRYQNLSCADLRDANLMGANLEGANLVSAKLQGANLQGAILKNAKLRRAQLDGADLRDAEYELADWRGASVAGTVLEGKVDIQAPRLSRSDAPDSKPKL
ncbi:MAG: pentapeptide repeat-containing protein [Pseudomonadota bacterium]